MTRRRTPSYIHVLIHEYPHVGSLAKHSSSPPIHTIPSVSLSSLVVDAFISHGRPSLLLMHPVRAHESGPASQGGGGQKTRGIKTAHCAPGAASERSLRAGIMKLKLEHERMSFEVTSQC